jgi:hypothetical protein
MSERRGEREAWTAFVEGREPVPESKYHSKRAGKYASEHEAEVAGSLAALERAGKIEELREQVRFVLVPKNGKLRAVVYVADFTYRETSKDVSGRLHILDAKGYKTQVYRLKKRMMAELGYEIEEV